MHIEFPRVLGYLPFISIRKGAIEIGIGPHAVTFGKYPESEGSGVYVCWM